MKKAKINRFDMSSSNFHNWIDSLIYFKRRVEIYHEGDIYFGVITQSTCQTIVLSKLENGFVCEEVDSFNIEDIHYIKEMN